MESIGPNYLFYGLIAILLILLITSIIKKAFKLLTIILAIIIGFSIYNVLVKGVSPKEEIRSYKTDINYGKQVKNYSQSIKESVDNLKEASEGEITKEGLEIIIKENKNLHNYEKEVIALEHSSKLKLFHDKYCSYLRTIVKGSDSALNLANLRDKKNDTDIDNLIQKLVSNVKQLSELNLK